MAQAEHQPDSAVETQRLIHWQTAIWNWMRQGFDDYHSATTKVKANPSR